jgi:uncharacterized membrane protein YqhA
VTRFIRSRLVCLPLCLAVILGLVIFAEWRNVDPWKLLAAAVLIVAGGVLASRA